MISKELMIAGGVGIAAVIGLVVAASSAGAAPASGSFVFTAGHRYEIDLAVPPSGSSAVNTSPTVAGAQGELDAIASGAFKVAGVGLTYPGTAAPGSAVTLYVLVDVLVTTTVAQSILLAGTPTGTTVTARDEGLSPTSGAGSSLPAAGVSGTAASSASSSTSTPAAAPPNVPATSVTGSPPTPASGAAQWMTTIVLGPEQTVLVTYWPGDTISVSPPAGATWASSGSPAGAPTSGAAPYAFVAGSTLATLSFAWTLAGTTTTTTLSFTQGRTWAPARAWGPLDTVRISLSAADYAAMVAAGQSGSYPAEVAALTAMSTQLAATIGTASVVPAQGLSYFLTTGPWSAALGIIADASGVLAPAPTLLVWVAASTVLQTAAASSYPAAAGSLPADWPSDGASIMRAEYQSQGATRADIASVPFPLLAWIRTT